MSNQTDDRKTGKTMAEILSPKACDSCKLAWLANRPALHEGCKMRAVLAQAPDHPAYDDLGDLTYEQRQALPARFHVPVWDGDGVPHAWLCAVCWDDGEVCRWPCATAAEHGGEVFER